MKHAPVWLGLNEEDIGQKWGQNLREEDKWNHWVKWKRVEMIKIWKNDDALVKIEGLGLKRSTNCIEEGKILTSKVNSNFDFDPKNGSRMSISKKMGQNII